MKSVKFIINPRKPCEFNKLLNILINNKEFRSYFFKNTNHAIKEMPLIFSDCEINELVNQAWVELEEKNARFDERLLLCCSIGY